MLSTLCSDAGQDWIAKTALSDAPSFIFPQGKPLKAGSFRNQEKQTTMDPTPNPQEAFVYQTKQWRRDLDECLQLIKQGSDKGYTGEREPDHPVRSSRERSLAITKVEEAIMWLGMDLKAQNTPNPYPHSKDPTSLVIEPTADGLKM